jgi:hypothetical protein
MDVIELTRSARYYGEAAVNLAAFTSASGSLIAAVRGVCNPNSRFRSCHALLGSEFSAVRRRNTMHRFFLALILLSLSVSTGAVAEERSGTPDEQKACSRDVQRYCRPVIDQGDFTILACLQQNRPKLTLACNQVLKDHGQ